MKKITCLLFVLIICLSFIGCNNKGKNNNTITNPPLKEINTVYDECGNLIQQTVYNELLDEYTTTTFIYTRVDNVWVCVDQKIQTKKGQPIEKNNIVQRTPPSINIFYKQNLAYEPIILLDNNDIKISIVEYLDKAAWWEFGYKIKVENKSDRTLTTMFDYVSILDINCKPLFSIDQIDSDRTVYFNLAWNKDSLERAWIPYIDNIEFTLKVYDCENWNTPAIYDTRVLIKH